MLSEPKELTANNTFVIPAKAGIQLLPMKFIVPVLDPRLRGGDETVFGKTV
jgi:hypothetical protein